MIINPDPLVVDPAATRQIGPYTVEMIQLARFRMDGGGGFGVIPKVLWSKAYPHFDERNRVHLAAYALLVRGPGMVLVADSGIGDKINDKTRDIFAVDQPDRVLPRALELRGIKPDDVTHFVFTHLHFDHAGGATETDASGRLVPLFSRARHYVQGGHMSWANSPSDKDKASFDPQNWDAIVDAGLMHELDGDHSPAPGIEFRNVHGHTSGMQMILVHDGDGDGLLYSVDLFPTSAHLPPHYVPAFDNHPLVSLEEKRLCLEELHGRGWHLAFGHDPYQSPARVTRDERGRWIIDPEG